MRSTVVNLFVTLFAVAILAACSSTTTSSGGTATSGPVASPVNTGVVKSSDVTPPKPADVKATVGNIVYFDFDKAIIRPDAHPVLMAYATRLSKSGAKAVLEGHCDERGSRKYNMGLGDRRAKAVRDFLITQGVKSSQFETISYGKDRPVDTRHNEEAWAKNRRVEIKQ